jgi:ParB family transcriptional regulator, chromosome partitioning protein
MTTATKSPKSKVQSPKSKDSNERFPPCKSCGAPIEEPARWTTYGGIGLCGDCDPHAPEARQGTKDCAGCGKPIALSGQPHLAGPAEILCRDCSTELLSGRLRQTATGAVELLRPNETTGAHEWQPAGRPSPAKPNGRASRASAADTTLSTTTPAGIAALDPLASHGPPATDNGQSRKEPFRFTTSIGSLGRNRFNPRERFDDAELAELAESLQRHGQIQPIVVRPAEDGVPPLKPESPGHTKATLEIVAGERRALAALQIGWTRINVEQIECDDARACELAIAENRDRRDISQVEYARGLKRLAELKGLDTKALAQDQHLAESSVRNLLGLLAAPDEWQQMVIDGKISGTHLRHAKPYLHVEQIAADLRKHIDAQQLDGAFRESEKVWQETVRDVVRHRAAEVTRRVSVMAPEWKSTEVKIDPKDPRAAELDIVELPAKWGGKPEKFALNRKLANEMLTAKANIWKAKHGKPQVGKTAKATNELTPAEAKARAKAEADARRAALEECVDDWVCWLCSRAAAANPDVAQEVALSIALGASSLWDDPWVRTDWPRFIDPLKRAKALASLAAEQFYGPPGPAKGPRPTPKIYGHAGQAAELRYWRDRLSIDPAAAWRAKDADGKQQFLGPVTEAWLDLHDRDGLADLAAEWSVPVLDKDTADDLRRKLTSNAARVMPLPKEIAELVHQGKGQKAKGGRKPR